LISDRRLMIWSDVLHTVEDSKLYAGCLSSYYSYSCRSLVVTMFVGTGSNAWDLDLTILEVEEEGDARVTKKSCISTAFHPLFHSTSHHHHHLLHLLQQLQTLQQYHSLSTNFSNQPNKSTSKPSKCNSQSSPFQPSSPLLLQHQLSAPVKPLAGLSALSLAPAQMQTAAPHPSQLIRATDKPNLAQSPTAAPMPMRPMPTLGTVSPAKRPQIGTPAGDGTTQATLLLLPLSSKSSYIL
jgi:hypothetical protein